MEMKKPQYGARPASANVSSEKKSNLKKITGLFKTEQGSGFEVRVNEEILAALSGISVGDFLKVYQNESKDGSKTYLSLNVKPIAKRA